MEILLLIIIWILSQWKAILGFLFVVLIFKIITNDIGNLLKKINDIDRNVKAIAKSMEVFGTEEENKKTPLHKKTFTEIYKEQKRKDLDI